MRYKTIRDKLTTIWKPKINYKYKRNEREKSIEERKIEIFRKIKNTFSLKKSLIKINKSTDRITKITTELIII